MPSPPRFTVVVPTRNRPHALSACLAALGRQEGCDEFDVLVVDDGSSDGERVAAAVGRAPRARLVRTPPAGSAAARNAGVRETRTEFVLLLDDDCLPKRRWAASLVAALEAGAVAAAGPVVNSSRSDVYGEATQIVLDGLTQSADRGDGVTAFVPTYNLACRRELLVDLPFEVRHTSAAADRDWCARLVARGAAGVTIVPEAVVVHRQLLDFRRFCRKHYDYGRGSSYFHRRHGVGFGPPGFYLGLVGTGFSRGPLVGLAVCVSQLATGLGFGVELVAGGRQRALSG